MTTMAALLLVLKASVLLTLALAVAHAFRRTHAARRHGLWTATFAALVALPFLGAFVPALSIPVPALAPAASFATTENDVGSDVVGGLVGDIVSETTPASVEASQARRVAESHAQRSFAPSPVTIAFIVWGAGVLVALGGVVRSVVTARRLATNAAPLDDASWSEACVRTAKRLGITQPVRVVASDGVVTPMAGGIVRPTVFVPPSAREWSDEQRDIVLSHELAHLANGDPWRHLIARVAFAIYWFHPFLWLASRKAMTACEQACDDAVLALGVRPSTYARVLLGFAAATPNRFAALAIARRTSLETRLVSILDNNSRSSAPRRKPGSVAIVALATVLLAAARPTAPRAPEPAPTSSPAAPAEAPAMTAMLPDRRPATKTVTEPVAQPEATRATAPAAAPATSPTAPVQDLASAPVFVQQAAECTWDNRDRRSFTGSSSTTSSGIRSRVGTFGGDTHIIQRSFGDLRVCAIATEMTDRQASARPSEWSRVARRVVLETGGAGGVRQMTIDRGDITYSINGRSASVDAAALEWRDALYEVLDGTWDISQLRGQVASKRGEIASIHGERASLRGQIASAQGEVASMRGEQGSIRGEVASMRGEIASIYGQEASLRGQIASLQGSIASLEATRYDVSAAERARIDDRISRIRAEIRSVEEEIRRYDADARARVVERRIAQYDENARSAAVDRRIRDADVDRRIERVNRQIAELDVDRRVAEIEREIERLDADRRVPPMEDRLDRAVARLRRIIE